MTTNGQNEGGSRYAPGAPAGPDFMTRDSRRAKENIELRAEVARLNAALQANLLAESQSLAKGMDADVEAAKAIECEACAVAIEDLRIGSNPWHRRDERDDLYDKAITDAITIIRDRIPKTGGVK